MAQQFSDGTGREPAVAEVSRSVPARTALSLCALVDANQLALLTMVI
jgi:hypothetical protein